MKKFYRNSFRSLLMIQLVFGALSANAQERDPFSPTGSMMNQVKGMISSEDATASPSTFNAGSPLTSSLLSGYKVTGVILSDTQKIASVKAINNVSYLVKVGDSLGSEGGKVSDITLDHIIVQTESQEIKLPVSNIIEVPIENTGKK